VPAGAFRSLSISWTIERAETPVGTSSCHDGTTAQKPDPPEKRRMAQSPRHDRAHQARTPSCGGNANWITEQEFRDVQQSP
jgi:hypothetical protein